jgi:type II secretory pathway pseudopilin PulG
VTLLEVVVTVAILMVAMSAIFVSIDRATTTASFTQRRNEALDDLRIMAAAFGKDARQGVEARTVSPTQFEFETYIDGTLSDVIWRAVTDTDDDRLERVVNGGVANVYVVDLTTTAVFSYFGEVNPAQVNRVRLSLATRPDDRFEPVGLSTEVEMRNVG